ncbi:MAG: hypothetical protein PHH47_10035 [Gallionella sp.]|nr:hypothetical protein [Gallionella sp.]MDD4947195.1 hypothetical protein [Gallionella sp.]
MSQTRKHSLLESLVNVALGYGIALAAQLTIFPMFGIHISFQDNLLIGALFTVVSIVRSYALRRLFNRWHQMQRHGQGATRGSHH